MNDTISRAAALDAIRASTSKYMGFMEMEMYTEDDAVEAIKNLPSAQSEIILCKDCKEYYAHDHRCRWWNHGTNEAGWCSYAERREE